MFSPRYPEFEHAAFDKADEGARLLAVRDYEGAIEACTDAIEWEPGSLGAYRTRAEAYKHLGLQKESAADLIHLRERLGDEATLDEGNPSETSEDPVWNHFRMVQALDCWKVIV